MKKVIKRLFGKRLSDIISRIVHPPKWVAKPFFDYDLNRLIKYGGGLQPLTRGKALSSLIVSYHIIEKGLTMPNRRFGFGKDSLRTLIDKIIFFEKTYGIGNKQVNHAIGVVRAYWNMHLQSGMQSACDKAFWDYIAEFLGAHKDIPPATQLHLNRTEFYKDKYSSFNDFAMSRHTLRHYSGERLSDEKIKLAVEIARTTPSACNRQYCRVYCLSDRSKMEQLLAIQRGSRGFGHLADKLLIVVSDLEGIVGIQERDDIFTNGGMFLMNLCYALHYNEVAHCILNWSRTPEEDLKMRKIVAIKPSETVIAILTCGEAPDHFDVALSPRKDSAEILKFLDADS